MIRESYRKELAPMTYGRGGSVRAFSAIVLIAGLGFLSACGGNGTPAGVAVTITLSASLTSLTPGQSTSITASVANDTTNKGVSWSIASGGGTLSNATSTSVTYTAPASVPTPTSASILATSVASPTVTQSIQIALQSSSVSISLSPAAPQTINQGQQLAVNATLTNDTGSKGVTWALTPTTGAGTLTNATSTAVTYVAPSSVAANTPVTITATSVASSTATAALEITVFPSGAGPNVAALNVNSGPAANAANIAYISVTLCVPTTTTCQTVDNIQVDTGSVGLRILQSAIPALPLPTITDTTTGQTLQNCVQFGDGSYLWGPVQQADIKIGGEVASSVPVQQISSSSTGIPTACSNGSTSPGDENTPGTLEANGIIGVGLEPTDCIVAGTDFCDGSAGNTSPPNVYFECPSTGCAPVFVPQSAQVTHPVVGFAADNNGVAIQLPAVTSAAATLSGTLIFGINTESNNVVPSTALAYGLDTNDNFVTVYSGQTLTASFLDSGSNALYFPSSITVCTDNASFYCPSALTPQSAITEGATDTPQSTVDFSVDNADNLFNNNPNDTAFGTLGGPNGTPNTCSGGNGSCSFDWGLPFFFGRAVFTAIDGQTVSGIGTGPFWAY
jgi:hypothetical protein